MREKYEKWLWRKGLDPTDVYLVRKKEKYTRGLFLIDKRIDLHKEESLLKGVLENLYKKHNNNLLHTTDLRM